MIFNRTTEYAFRIMSFLASDKEKLHNTSDIFDALHIPFRYLRKQMTVLTKTGLVVSIQGKYGGYMLAKKEKDITLWDIVIAMHDKLFETNCFFGYEKCALSQHCMMHSRWAGVKEMIENILKTTTLEDFKKENMHDLIKMSDQ